MKRIGYIRVSTEEQRPDRQIEGLRGLCDELHVERASAAKGKRPIYAAVIDRLRPGDCLVVWDLDRAFRSVVDAVTEAESLRARGIEFRIVNLDVDTRTPHGMFIYTIWGAVGALERQILVARTKEGLAAARSRGQRLGRPPKLSSLQLADARRRLLQPGVTLSALADEFGVAPWTLTRSLRRQSVRH